jgi:hypothetical protein
MVRSLGRYTSAQVFTPSGKVTWTSCSKIKSWCSAFPSIGFLEPFAEDLFGRAELVQSLGEVTIGFFEQDFNADIVGCHLDIIALEVPLSRDGTRMDDGVRIPGILTPHHWYKYKQPILGLKDRSSLD